MFGEDVALAVIGANPYSCQLTIFCEIINTFLTFGYLDLWKQNLKKMIFKKKFITSIEGKKHEILSDDTYTSLEQCFYDEDFAESQAYIYKCVFFFEFEKTFCVNLWNGSYQFDTIEEMMNFIDTIEL